MRTSLLHPLADRRHRRRPRVGRLAFATHEPPSPTTRSDAAGTTGSEISSAQRVREAGGPVDEACYPCSCGYFFIAPVSTSVACPHCGITQAW
jgi:hypothetical protein